MRWKNCSSQEWRQFWSCVLIADVVWWIEKRSCQTVRWSSAGSCLRRKNMSLTNDLSRWRVKIRERIISHWQVWKSIWWKCAWWNRIQLNYDKCPCCHVSGSSGLWLNLKKKEGSTKNALRFKLWKTSLHVARRALLMFCHWLGVFRGWIHTGPVTSAHPCTANRGEEKKRHQRAVMKLNR